MPESQKPQSAPRSAAPQAGLGDVQALEQLKAAYEVIQKEVRRVIVGQDEVVEQVLISIFARGHVLLVGVPGLAKTLLVRSLADSLSLSFARIQFTPDLMPADITGTEVIQDDPVSGERKFKFLPGPVFNSMVLADEINRTPPKTQAALLEAMQERSVSVGGVTHKLPDPFFVLATQNPIEQEGTYPLPEAQLDRFMFKIMVNYPTETEEYDIVKATTAIWQPQLRQVLGGQDILALQDIVRRVPAAEHVIKYAMKVVRQTRLGTPEAPDFINEMCSWGAGPRACQYLVLGGKARAVLNGRYYVSCEDIRAVAHPVLRHRIITNFNAEAEGITTDKIVDRLLEVTPSAESEALSDKRAPQVLKEAKA
jgi:MoxR-like ATPase